MNSVSCLVVNTDISPLVLQEIRTDLQQFKQEQSYITRDNKKFLDTTKRNCITASVPATKWYVGMLWHHLSRANDHGFHYDIKCFDGDAISYISYTHNQFYKWHVDTHVITHFSPSPRAESKSSFDDYLQRKLSFSFILNDDYEGGLFQVMNQTDDSMKTVQPKAGQMIIFDSRYKHRVTPVKNGKRDVLVGWAVGPNWR